MKTFLLIAWLAGMVFAGLWALLFLVLVRWVNLVTKNWKARWLQASPIIDLRMREHRRRARRPSSEINWVVRNKPSRIWKFTQ